MTPCMENLTQYYRVRHSVFGNPELKASIGASGLIRRGSVDSDDSSALVIMASISSSSASELSLTYKVHENPTYLVRTRRSNDIHQEGSRRPAPFPVRVRAYCLSTPREG